MTNKVFLNIKDLVNQILLGPIDQLTYCQFEEQSLELTSDEIEQFHLNFICLSLKNNSDRLHLMDFAFAEQHHIEYHQILDLLLIGELEVVKKILKNIKELEQGIIPNKLEGKSLLVQKYLGESTDPTIVECSSFKDLEYRLLSSKTKDLEYCSYSNKYQLEDVWNLNTALGFRSKNLNTVWTIAGNNDDKELTKAYELIFTKDKQYLASLNKEGQ